MIVVPAIDLREGRCVRLREGRDDARTVFSDDPVAMAERWAAAGAERLHVVDLDGAFAGAPRQTGLIAKIVEAVRPVPVEAGGGLRDLAAVEAVLEAGVTWPVVGTRAAVDAAFLAEVCVRFPERIIVAAPADSAALRAALEELWARWNAGTLDGTRLSDSWRERLSRAARVEELAEVLREAVD